MGCGAALERRASWKLADERPRPIRLPARGRGVDRSLEIAGLAGWREWLRNVPDRPLDAIERMLARLGVPEDEREAYLYRLLGGHYGWASYLRRACWEPGGGEPGEVVDLLAVRVCGDAAVASLARGRGRRSAESLPARTAVEDEETRLVLQEALEDAFTRGVLGRVSAPTEPVGHESAPARPAVQAVFCIDVRSEPMRRHLEAQSESVETLGFAGFFGVSLDWREGGYGSARCPVLLKPAVSLEPEKPSSSGAAGAALKSLQAAPAAGFSLVELLGLAYGATLAGDAVAAIPPADSAEGSVPFDLEPGVDGTGVSAGRRLDMACGILKNMSLRAPYARVVLLCGHEGHSANNAHAAGLDCGACGGHGGAVNARVAAALLNDPSVRAGLPARGWHVPADTRFIPAVHDTSVDEVRILDADRIPASHTADVAQLRAWLDRAGAATRAERAGALGVAPQPEGLLRRLLGRRSRDWSEVRPEWGLARNAAFVAARRMRTRGVDLQGRAFL
ncbi:MAG: putative inorganic carbon transporter subunit DabA, partial [Isosphaeraceae bacterium]